MVVIDFIKNSMPVQKKANSKQQTVYKELANDLVLLLRHTVYYNFKLRIIVE